MAGKRIFITGVAGFLGSCLAKKLLEEGHEVVGCDNLIGGAIENLPKGVEFSRDDCISRAAMLRLSKNCDIVYHCACTPHEGLSVFSPHLITQNTFGITASVLSASIENNIERFVFCSSMARYGTQKKLPFTENMQPKPQDPYGIAKYASELLIESLAEVHDFEYTIAAPHNIYGPKQKYDDPYRNVVAIMINRMLQGKQPIIYGDGKQKRCFSYIDDVVGCMIKLGFKKGISGEVFNVGPDEEFVTINGLAKLIAELIDFELKPEYVPGRPGEVKHAGCSAEKARKILGYRTTVHLREGLEKSIDFVREREPKPFNYHLDIEIHNKKTPKQWTEKGI